MIRFFVFQCHYLLRSGGLARSYGPDTGAPVTIHPVDSLEKAKGLP